MVHWIKFNVVGVLGFAMQVGALFLLTHSLPRISYLLATTIAVELAVVNNFVWHQRWTWSNRPAATRSQTLRRFAKFNVTSGLVSICGNLIFMSILVGQLGVAVVIANLLSVLLCSLFSFVLADRFAFKASNEPARIARA